MRESSPSDVKKGPGCSPEPISAGPSRHFQNLGAELQPTPTLRPSRGLPGPLALPAYLLGLRSRQKRLEVSPLQHDRMDLTVHRLEENEHAVSHVLRFAVNQTDPIPFAHFPAPHPQSSTARHRVAPVGLGLLVLTKSYRNSLQVPYTM